jgi:hypothetical protein
MSSLTTTQGFAPTSITEAIKFSEMLAKSQMVPRQYQGKPEDVLVAIQWGCEVGLAPLQSLQNIAVQGHGHAQQEPFGCASGTSRSRAR